MVMSEIKYMDLNSLLVRKHLPGTVQEWVTEAELTDHLLLWAY